DGRSRCAALIVPTGDRGGADQNVGGSGPPVVQTVAASSTAMTAANSFAAADPTALSADPSSGAAGFACADAGGRDPPHRAARARNAQPSSPPSAMPACCPRL